MNPYREPSPPPSPPPRCEGDSACYRDVRYGVWLDPSEGIVFRMCGSCAERYLKRGWSCMRFPMYDQDGRNTRFVKAQASRHAR